ncbi:uncharacterized protein F5147DRAFT_839046 [Suillus discolor]|uniref:Uncharacterized protein n=1 Tax=Suillus discolor TaxID=1912936 RepID=A0A9P7JRA6_9AGAM|nr:uncharacterized protein F5147DRAFT_839046 [Suillus discolor]KAG2101364.1 hypothetical protein F5147DRAFT_839046 [Suillus discolor]
MNSFKKLFQESHDDRTPSLKHSKSMTYGLSSQGSTRDPRADPVKLTYRGKTPLKTSDIVYIEQAPGVLDIRHAQDLRDLTPPRAHLDTYADLLDQFPNPPPPPPRPPRSALRTTSLNSKNSGPQLPLQNCNTSYQHVAGRQRTTQRRPSVVCFSRPTTTAYPSLVRKQRHEATDDQAVASVLQTADGQVCVAVSGRQADYVRVNSSAGRSHSSAPVPPACPIPTTNSQRPPISHSAYSSRTNLRRVPSRITIPRIAAPDHGQSYKLHKDYRDFLREQDPNVISAMINNYPKAPRDDPSQEPILFDMEDPSDFRKTLSYFIYLALAQGCPLDARADGFYHRIINAGDPTGVAPEVGADWSQQVENR